MLKIYKTSANEETHSCPETRLRLLLPLSLEIFAAHQTLFFCKFLVCLLVFKLETDSVLQLSSALLCTAYNVFALPLCCVVKYVNVSLMYSCFSFLADVHAVTVVRAFSSFACVLHVELSR